MSISQSTIYVFLLFSSLLELIHAAQLEIRNQCPYTVWAAAVWAAAVPAGGKQLNSSQSWTITVPEGTTQTRIWGRTGCTFDASGRGQCRTGDCGGVLECTDYGFNLPMDFSPTTVGCRGGARCSGDINSQCPKELRAPGGWNNPCTVFKTDQYCCNSDNCGPTNFSRFFKDRCPDAYSYPMDNQTHTVICPFGTNYRVVFCP